MRKVYVMALLAMSVSLGGSYAVAENDTYNFKAPAVEPARGNVSSDAQRAERTAALKAKMKAIEEGKEHPAVEKVNVPLEDRTVHGTDQIKAKMEASKKTGEKGTAKLKEYVSGVFGSLQGLSDVFSGPEDKEKLAERDRERNMSFKERLNLELEKQKQRTEAK
jgi:hypothetical protein